MENRFVNIKLEPVKGEGKLESAIDEKMSEKSEDTVKRSTIKEGKNILIGLCTDPKAKELTGKFTILCDNNEPLLEVDKKVLHSICQEVRKQEALTSGLTWLQCNQKHMVNICFPFNEKINTLGDISGVVFYFRS